MTDRTFNVLLAVVGVAAAVVGLAAWLWVVHHIAWR